MVKNRNLKVTIEKKISGNITEQGGQQRLIDSLLFPFIQVQKERTLRFCETTDTVNGLLQNTFVSKDRVCFR